VPKVIPDIVKAVSQGVMRGIRDNHRFLGIETIVVVYVYFAVDCSVRIQFSVGDINGIGHRTVLTLLTAYVPNRYGASLTHETGTSIDCCPEGG